MEGRGDLQVSRGAGVFPVDPQGRTLLLRRVLGREPRTWSTPGGFREPGESPLRCALREWGEETGYQGPFQVGAPWRTRSGSPVFPMRVQHFRPRLSAEHDKAAWVRPGSMSRYPLSSTMRSGRLNVFAGDDLRDFIEAHEGSGRLKDYYPSTSRGETPVYAGEIVHRGRRVGWPGTPGELVEVDEKYAYPIEGNIFDWNKLAAVADSVKAGRSALSFEGPVFRPGYGIFSVVDRSDIKESLEYGTSGYGRAYTTGDEDLDFYLTHPDPAIEERDDVVPGQRGYKAAKLRFEREVRAAERSESGDFGALTVQVRDGNHRTFGSIIGGEPTVWVQIYGNQVQDLKDPEQQYPSIRRLRKELGIKPVRKRR